MATIAKQKTTTITRATARAAGLTRYFTGKPCPHGHVSERLATNGTCVTCSSLKTTIRRESREIARRGKADPNPDREAVDAPNWRKVTGGNMSGWYGPEPEVLQKMYGELRDSFELDYGVPKVATDLQGKRGASRVDCWASVVKMLKQVNGIEPTQLNPEANRAQRPANRYPGGAFDPEPTEREWLLISLAEEQGTPADKSLRTLSERLDAMAREYEQHVATLLARMTGAVAV